MSFFDNIFGNGDSSANKYANAAKNEVIKAGDQANTYISPFATQGANAYSRLNSLYGGNGATAQAGQWSNFINDPLTQKLGLSNGYQQSPGYKFQLQQGLGAIDSSAASKGLLGSGATLKAEQEYGQGLAAQDYNQYLDRLTNQYQNYTGGLQSLANSGQQASTQIGNNLLGARGAGANQTAQIGANKTAGANGIAGLVSSLANTAIRGYNGGQGGGY